jgi:hypothetical protein
MKHHALQPQQRQWRAPAGSRTPLPRGVSDDAAAPDAEASRAPGEDVVYLDTADYQAPSCFREAPEEFNMPEQNASGAGVRGALDLSSTLPYTSSKSFLASASFVGYPPSRTPQIKEADFRAARSDVKQLTDVMQHAKDNTKKDVSDALRARERQRDRRARSPFQLIRVHHSSLRSLWPLSLLVMVASDLSGVFSNGS